MPRAMQVNVWWINKLKALNCTQHPALTKRTKACSLVLTRSLISGIYVENVGLWILSKTRDFLSSCELCLCVGWSQHFAIAFFGCGCGGSLAGRVSCVCPFLSWPHAGIPDFNLAPLLNVLLWKFLTSNSCSPRTLSMFLLTHAHLYSLGRRHLSPCCDLKPYKIISMTCPHSCCHQSRRLDRYTDSEMSLPSCRSGLSWRTGRAKSKQGIETHDVQ